MLPGYGFSPFLTSNLTFTLFAAEERVQHVDPWLGGIPGSERGPGGQDLCSTRRKMQIYSPESPSDESLSSPILDADYLFPGPLLLP
ncbi:hypothetical protein KUCAC02_012536 [Chaenocephalus aceratus]|uniref:Uncharacterized protein n=1 Tax=Chaenocephalus aceratus TaxID=36190 RepID=A0ACB9XBI2_CHAAC|nr:hypothetical protein KUCAC02_012536 [Chaenocephalus aceratus]